MLQGFSLKNRCLKFLSSWHYIYSINKKYIDYDLYYKIMCFPKNGINIIKLFKTENSYIEQSIC